MHWDSSHRLFIDSRSIGKLLSQNHRTVVSDFLALLPSEVYLCRFIQVPVHVTPKTFLVLFVNAAICCDLLSIPCPPPQKKRRNRLRSDRHTTKIAVFGRGMNRIDHDLSQVPYLNSELMKTTPPNTDRFVIWITTPRESLSSVTSGCDLFLEFKDQTVYSLVIPFTFGNVRYRLGIAKKRFPSPPHPDTHEPIERFSSF